MSVTAFGHEKISAQKIKKQFFSKINSILLKSHAEYFTIFIYLATGRAAKVVFVLILHSQIYPDVAKA